ncbi:putative transcriptional regulator YheO [Streptomyces sp. SAI-135]|uniref:helix-turn-helix transcriptional regulator n=1 Tax=unclassified Streptomyces TaxID=2593676 RepID=UPI002475B002|nr:MULTISPECIES: PAS domain-containing protein [unclassified Streptomyces]MDH6514487.1 putative transcriptional regulator YheO [Streptomyces sp. SAI-090]MDH6565771.1 putative transcriptional regulator YheO [Streptomyces sp. SAI-117]MDH6621430.1 putative transcriptional regulator YheO [Streptomyces sp. SAI-135]
MTGVVSGADEHLIGEAEKIAVALGRMFPGLCEVVLHDLRDPRHAIRAIENNLSGRRVGDSATELGLARIADPDYPSIIQNYPNRFPDGRPAKSTSIGIKNQAGEYVAALCLNLDVSVLSPVTLALSNLVATDTDTDTERREEPLETLRDRTARELRRTVEELAAERAATPRSLSREDKKALVRRLHRDGYFDSRDAAQTIADLLGVSRATVYNYSK